MRKACALGICCDSVGQLLGVSIELGKGETRRCGSLHVWVPQSCAVTGTRHMHSSGEVWLLGSRRMLSGKAGSFRVACGC